MMGVLKDHGDRVLGERIVCYYRKERSAVLVRLTGGHRGLRRTIEGLPAVAIVDKPLGRADSSKK